MLRLTQWMADYYLCPWGQVLEAVVPAGVRGMAGTREVKFLTAVPDALAKFAALKLRSPQQRKALEALAASERPLTAPELAEVGRLLVGADQVAGEAWPDRGRGGARGDEPRCGGSVSSASCRWS